MARLTLLALIIILLFGCSVQKAYKGNVRDSQSISIISPPAMSFFDAGPMVVIRQVDDIKLDRLKSGAFDVIPGEHSIIVKLFKAPGPMGGIYINTLPIKMTFVTKPGEKYVVDYEYVEGKTVFFIQEESSGTKVEWW